MTMRNMRNMHLDAQLRHLEHKRSMSSELHDLTYDDIDRAIDDLRFEAIMDELEHQDFRLKWIQDKAWSANFRLVLIMVPLYLYIGWEVAKAVL